MISRLALVVAAAAGFALVGCAEQPMFNVGPVPGGAPTPQAPPTLFSGTARPAPPLDAPPVQPVAAVPTPPADGNGIIGIKLGVVNGGVCVQQVAPDSAADEAGVIVGDLVLAVDGAPTGAMTLVQIRHRLRGPEGSSVVVRFQRGNDAPFERTLTRRAFSPAPPVDAQVPPPPSAPDIPTAPAAEHAPPGDNSDAEARLLP